MSSFWEHAITPRFNDVDGLRHVNNTVVPVWLEEARSPLMRCFCPDFSLETWTIITARIEVDFLAQMVLNQEVSVQTFVVETGRSSIRVGQKMFQRGVQTARGLAVLVHFDFDAQRIMPIGQDVLDRLAEYTLTKPERDTFLEELASRAR